MNCELGSIVCDNANSEPIDDVSDKFNGTLRLEDGDGLDLNPLGELVDGDQEVIEAPGRFLELAHHVEALDREWLHDGHCLEHLGRCMGLFGIVLACLACPDEFLGIGKGRQPIEPMSEGLPH